MPDTALHAAFGREVRKAMPREIGEKIREIPYTFALFGPDTWFLYQPWKRREGRGRRMHTTRTGAFLTALARQAKESRHPEEMFSYLAGFLCHYALDSETHPYIIYMTEKKTKIPRGHMAFEHTLDTLEMERAGYRGEKHPVTDHYYPRMRLPEEIREDLNRVYESVYGWKNSWQALNRCFARFRLACRQMENPKSLFSRAARLTGHPALRAMSYAYSPFNGTDVENAGGAEWEEAYAPERKSTLNFAAMRERARRSALEMIREAYRYIFLSEITGEEFAERIGSRSYLSGLPEEDPRNRTAGFLQPPRGAEERTGGK